MVDGFNGPGGIGDGEGYSPAALKRLRDLLRRHADLVAQTGLAAGLPQSPFAACLGSGGAPPSRVAPAARRRDRRRR